MACTATITQSTGTATLEEWAKLDLDAPNSRVLRLTRVQLDANSHPLGVEEVVLALERFPGLAANGGDVPDLIDLAQRHGLSLRRTTERLAIVRASSPSDADAAAHDLKGDTLHALWGAEGMLLAGAARPSVFRWS